MRNELDDLAYGVKWGSEISAAKLYDALRRYLHEIITSKSIPGMVEDEVDHDVFHEVYIEIVTKISQWREESSFGSWCYPIARRKMIDLWRATQTAKHATLDVAASLDYERGDEGESLAGMIVGDSGDVDREVCVAEEVAGLLAKVREMRILSEYEEEALLLYGEGWKIRDIAEKMQRGGRSISNAIQRAKSKCLLASQVMKAEESNRRLSLKNSSTQPCPPRLPLQSTEAPIGPTPTPPFASQQLAFAFLLAS